MACLAGSKVNIQHYGKEETVNSIIRECSKLVSKKYKMKLDWVETVIHLGLCKRLKIDYIDKLYIHKPDSPLKTETHKMLQGLEI